MPPDFKVGFRLSPHVLFSMWYSLLLGMFAGYFSSCWQKKLSSSCYIDVSVDVMFTFARRVCRWRRQWTWVLVDVVVDVDVDVSVCNSVLMLVYCMQQWQKNTWVLVSLIFMSVLLMLVLQQWQKNTWDIILLMLVLMLMAMIFSLLCFWWFGLFADPGGVRSNSMWFSLNLVSYQELFVLRNKWTTLTINFQPLQKPPNWRQELKLRNLATGF